ncbi:MAG TPA: excinuclease ABC subunit UvrA [Steroidobacteraceae bacterium]|nr:excinuclease ABC subunit UvrA [Steroidobacteraceae bacterium]
MASGAAPAPARKGAKRKAADTQPKLMLEMVLDRFRLATAERSRVIEAIETSLRIANGRVNVHVLEESDRESMKSARAYRFSADLHCANCDIHYQEPTPSSFSFNSPVGACESCRGFGRIIGVDFGLVVPDQSKSLKEGAVRPWQTESYRECQDDLVKYARKRGIPLDVPWKDLTEAQREWVLEGEGRWEDKLWYGVRRFFAWLESRAYKMHIRVLLSKYRTYTPCTDCGGARLKPDSLLWRVGTREDAAAVSSSAPRFRPAGVKWTDSVLASLPGLSIHELMLLPLEQCSAFVQRLQVPAPLDEASDLVLREIRTRLKYLLDVGLGYLTLDRQSRTLSGGEVQRINLTTALGTSLVNTLFVLDEPSIGLHPRDMGRVIGVMQRLKDAGNSLVVVEHDPQVMQAADRILDVGPGPGERGGEIVFYGAPDQLASATRSLTAEYLTGRKIVSGAKRDSGLQRTAYSLQPRIESSESIRVLGAREHNLKNIDVTIPLHQLVCVTGVSGSGKSTLVQDVLYPALRKRFGKPSEAPGLHAEIQGAEHISDVVFVDQTPIGRTTRSNPASYVGAFDAIRKLFAAEPLSKERGYTIGTFSFNSGNGRCPTCAGNGFEHVEMQFLSDVYLRCPDCNGTRYRPEIAEVKLSREGHAGRSIADILELTVAEALDYFRNDEAVAISLRPLAEVGLDYLRLGQPVPTLSGGEAQRLKLAGHLVEAAQSQSANHRSRKEQADRRGTLFLFDEPTTGLHFEDIEKLLRAFRRLIDAGNSLLVIEHNLDLIRAADWIVDLGPEGGDAGGLVVATGTPDELMRDTKSHTARALREVTNEWQPAGVKEPRVARLPATSSASIQVHGAREHNLKNIDVSLPRDRFTVITGVSGSGKSTLAFDIVFGEGQRRYLESLNAYARQFVQPASRPDVDAIFGIPPTVAIEQRTSRGGRKSTVATLTEIYHFLRLLFVKLGTQYCPDCDVPIEPQSYDSLAARLVKEYRGQNVTLLSPLVVARKGFYTDLAEWAAKKGYEHLRVDGELLPTAKWPRLSRFKEHTIELPVATLKVSPKSEKELRSALTVALDHGKGVVHVLNGRSKAQPQIYSTRRACPSCAQSFAELDPRLFSFNSKHGWCPECFGTGAKMRGFDEEQSGEEIWWNEWYEEEAQICEACAGNRLNPIALNVRFREQSIAQWTAQPVGRARKMFDALKLRGREVEIARDVLAEISSRLGFLEDVGLGYLSLDRSAPTLSGGEAQRIRLAAQLGSNLQGVCYILDEPTIGLHTRDNRILLDTLDRLAAKGNSLLVVEHDEETIRRADHVVDLGPGAGTRGGRIVAEGTAAQLERSPDSVTGRLLSRPLQHPLGTRRKVAASAPCVTVKDAELHNLKKQSCRVPLGRLVAVTGVSGSGKSTFARDVLHDNLAGAVSARRGSKVRWHGCRELQGWEQISRVLEVDQTPIGKTPRSCPATYVGFWDAIRRIFAETTEARMRGYDASRFSFNTAGGRCEACEGQGVRKIEMSFLPDVRVTCDSCGGLRFNADTLAIKFKDKSIGEVLMMSVDDAVEFFSAHSRVHHCLRLLQDVGLGYLTLGQQSPTLSGGEAQRIKLVTELSRVRSDAKTPRGNGGGSTLYVLDEPTVGLHMADIEKLIRVLHRLVDAGNTVVVIEHDLDVIAEADWIIDLGPEGGAEGGRVVAQGSPEDLVRSSRSHTARALAEFMRDRRRRRAA